MSQSKMVAVKQMKGELDRVFYSFWYMSRLKVGHIMRYLSSRVLFYSTFLPPQTRYLFPCCQWGPSYRPFRSYDETVCHMDWHRICSLDSLLGSSYHRGGFSDGHLVDSTIPIVSFTSSYSYYFLRLVLLFEILGSSYRNVFRLLFAISLRRLIQLQTGSPLILPVILFLYYDMTGDIFLYSFGIL